jgi:hypothetical protein
LIEVNGSGHKWIHLLSVLHREVVRGEEVKEDGWKWMEVDTSFFHLLSVLHRGGGAVVVRGGEGRDD